MNPGGTYDSIETDVSLIADIDKVVKTVKQKENKLDLLFMSSGFMAFKGRIDTREALDPSMTTRYYPRQRVLKEPLPLLNEALSPRVISVLAGGQEGPLIENNLDLGDPNN